MRPILLIVLLLGQAGATGVSRPPSPPASVVLKPARVFDGEVMHEGWAVRVKGDRIEAAGPASEMAAAGATVTDLPGATLMPGLVEGHSHVLLHPYDETPWNDQVLKESLGLRNGASGGPSSCHVDRRLHDHPRSRHGGRGLCGRGAQTGSQRRDRARAKNARVDARNRGDRQLCPERVFARMARASGRRRGRRRRAHPRRARPDRTWRRLDQGVRGLLLGAAWRRQCRRSRWTSSS